MEHTPEQLNAAFERLPERVQDAIASTELVRTIKQIGHKHDLYLDQLGELSDLIGLIMLGLKKPEKFLDDVKARLNVSISQAGAIVQDVNTEIFFPIRESLRQVTGTEEIPGRDNNTENKDLFSNKMSKLFNIKEERPTASPEKENTPPNTPIIPKRNDPYREPID